MKRILLILLILAVCLTVLSGCTPKKFKDLTENEIKSVSVVSSPDFYGYEYSFTGDKARAVVDYLSCLDLTPIIFELNDGGMGWIISIEYENGSNATVHHSGNKRVRINDGAWYRMKNEEAVIFESLLENLEQKE